MALTAKQVQELYLGYYGRPADPVGLAYWQTQTLEAAMAGFAASAEFTNQYAGMTVEQQVNQVYVNLLGRPSDLAGLLYWSGEIVSGRETIGTLVMSMQRDALGRDVTTLQMRADFAEAFTNALDTTDEVLDYSGQTAAAAAREAMADIVAASTGDTSTLTTALANLDSTVAGVVAGGGMAGQTYMLTKGLDNVPGTSGNDTIIGSIDNAVTPNAELNTLSSLDIVNGGAGVDTLSINVTGGPAVVLPNMTNVEIVNVESTVGATVNTSAVAGVTNLNVTKAAGAVAATAAATTDVSVSIKDSNFAAATDHTVTNGNNVTFNFTDAGAALVANADDIAITGAKGNVVVNATAKAAANTAATLAMGTITVTGGKTVSVTQKAGDAAGLVAGSAATTHTQGDVTVTADATTTDVTVKQDAAATAASTKAVAKVDEVATVTFTKLDSGQAVTVGDLTFTASKDLSADQVAAAFANLSATAPTPTQIAGAPATATGDTNGGKALADGTFTGTLLAKWSSAAASGNTVTFTASGAMTTDLAVSGTGATVVTNTQGVDAVTGANTLGVTNGVVAITGGAALKTVTVDGYAASATKGTNGIIGTTNTVLDTINLANGAGFVIESAAAALALDLKNVNGTVDVDAGTKTLNVSVSHAKATDTATLASNTAESVTVTGSGNVAGTTGAGANQLDAATSINTTGMTAGNATFTIADGTKTSYTGGAGVDSVTVSNAGTAITKAIDLGAGDDTLTLTGAPVVAPTATLKGGDGTDTIAMSGASAEALSANGTFAGKIEGFEKLSITDKVTVARTVNMANMDGITYVVSKNTTDVASAATKTTFTLDVAGSSATTGVAGDAVTFNTKTYTFTSAAPSDTAFATQLYGLILADQPNDGATGWVVTGVSGTKLTFEAFDAGVKATPANTDFGFADGGDSTGVGAFVTAEVTAGAAPGTAPALTIDKMANNGTLELVDAGDGVIVKMADATGSTDSFNIVTKVTGDLSFGTVDVAGVETLKLNAVDTTPGTAAAPTINTASLTVKADKATSLTIEGNSNVTLTLDATTTKLATIDAGTLTGKLDAGNTLNAVAMTITGGSGADVLKASVGATAKADVINGGDGNDTLVAGSNGAKLTGGAGNDIFLVTATAATDGNKESNTYTDILDFQAGDVLQLQYSNAGAAADVLGFAKLAATLNENTAVFSDFVNAAIKEAGAGAAVYFNYKGDAYVVIDSHTNSAADTFINGEDLVVKLTGINGDNLSWNSDYATVALI